MNNHIILLGLLPLILAACSSGESGTQSTRRTANPTVSKPEQSPVKRWFEVRHVNLGAEIYRNNCAVCHGKQGEGAPNWRQAGPDGKYPAPPLNGTGHAWHHPLRILAHVIKNGSPGGQGNMPAWKEKLSDSDVLAVIAWFQSNWPEELYAAWVRRDAVKRVKAG